MLSKLARRWGLPVWPGKCQAVRTRAVPASSTKPQQAIMPAALLRCSTCSQAAICLNGHHVDTVITLSKTHQLVDLAAGSTKGQCGPHKYLAPTSPLSQKAAVRRVRPMPQACTSAWLVALMYNKVLSSASCAGLSHDRTKSVPDLLPEYPTAGFSRNERLGVPGAQGGCVPDMIADTATLRIYQQCHRLTTEPCSAARNPLEGPMQAHARPMGGGGSMPTQNPPRTTLQSKLVAENLLNPTEQDNTATLRQNYCCLNPDG
jgi:hypothetical protein